MNRLRPDRCPGVLRPWPADDGLLVRVRLPGGRVRATAMTGLLDIAERFGDGRIHVTSRSNLQIRAMPEVDGGLPDEVVRAVEATGLLPSRRHDLARNVMASPQSGLAGGRADLRAVVDTLDATVCADRRLARLPGRFLFVLDDGRGDLVDRPCDLGMVALDGETAQLRIADGWGPTVALADAPRSLADLAHRFLDLRGDDPGAAWHVHELPTQIITPHQRSAAVPPPCPPLSHGPVPGGFHHPVADTGLDRDAVELLCAAAPELVVTPWRGVLIPEETP